MTGQEAVAYIESYYPHQTEPKLARIRALMARLGDPQKGLKFVHVAGTNGKGSTCAMVESILRAAGYRTGLYTSPHLIRLHERMQCGGVPITDEELAAALETVRPAAESMPEPINEFELITAVALLWFARKKCDIVALEVGLGGEFDATNVIDAPEVAVITNIGLDHTAILGDTLEKIASAKAGILKRGSDVVLYRGTAGVERVVEERCAAVGARLIRPDFGALRSVSSSLEGQVFDFGARRGLELPLLGAFQLRNAAVVLTVVDALRARGWAVSEEAVRRGLAEVRWPVRFQIVSRSPLFILDGGHNPQCLAAVAENLRALLPGTYLVFLLGVLSDKDARSMTELLAPLAGEFVAVTPRSCRALDADALAELLRGDGRPITVCADVGEGIETARAAARAHGGAVCCVGSLYLAGDVLAWFERRGGETS